ncbi:ClpX C4-type zinc finger protein [Cryptosporangium arvum]|uniref:ClpX C4-type zinc finger protein n=1 Tax=Cryptosporangium arvum TaxID=80871 RepID=UPI0004B91DAA|nr:ClpX C4-type zinc finger protein [Cryptosporangium arvum]
MTTLELACSFCSKPSTDVEKIVAGPGVYICNECVALATMVIESSTDTPSVPRVPIWESLTDDVMLSHIPRVSAHIDRSETELRSWVQELRRRGVTWIRIGESLGIARQSAWERFSSEE